MLEDSRRGSPSARRCGRRDAQRRAAAGRVYAPAMAETITLPGFVNAHSHTFQRALRGRAGGGDFWAWRELMLAEAERQTPASVRELYVETYRGDARRGLHGGRRVPLPRPRRGARGVDAAAEAGIELVLLLAAYARGGLPRMRQESPADYLRQLESLRADGVRVGLAPHSVRACPRDWLEELGRYAAAEALPLHVHADEQPREIEECLAEHGCRPIELLERDGLPRPPRHGRPRDARGRRRARPARRERHDRLRLPDDRGRPRGRLPPGRADRAPRHPALHRLRLERPDRPARGAARARGDRPPPDRAGAASSRPSGCSASAPTRARARSGSRRGRRSRSTSGTSRSRGVDAGRRLRRARLELRRRRRQRHLNEMSSSQTEPVSRRASTTICA